MYLAAKAPVQPPGNLAAQWVVRKQVEIEGEHFIPDDQVNRVHRYVHGLHEDYSNSTHLKSVVSSLTKKQMPYWMSVNSEEP